MHTLSTYCCAAAVILFAIAIAAIASSASASAARILRDVQQPNATARLIDLIDTRVGTGGFGYGIGAVNPAAQVPFGAMRLGPDTSLGIEALARIPFASEGGYYLNDNWLECFSHLHVDGAGMAEWQNFGVTVIRVDDPHTPPPTSMIVDAGYKSKYRHATEIAKPGYYAVTLETPGDVRAELTVSGNMAGMHRYTCGGNSNYAVVLDFCHGSPRTKHLSDFGYACRFAQVVDFAMSADNRSVLVTAMIKNQGEFFKAAHANLSIWWHANISLASSGGAHFADGFFWQDKKFVGDASRIFESTTSGSSGLVLPVVAGTTTAPEILVRASISFLDAKHAVENLDKQQTDPATGALFAFDAAKAATQQLWEDRLGHFAIFDNSSSSSSSPEANTFYNAVYRMFTPRTTYTESDGMFLGLDGRRYRNPPGQDRVSDLSLWDEYRTHMPMLTLVAPEAVADSVLSMNQMAHEMHNKEPTKKAYYPKWPMASEECWIMVGLHGVTVAMDALQKGVFAADSAVAKETFELCLAAVNAQNEAAVAVNGTKNATSFFVPIERGGAGHTLEFEINAAAVRNAALKVFGNKTVAAALAPYTQMFTSLWSDAHQYLLNWRICVCL